MSSLITTPIRCSFVLIISALLVSGCSSSSDSGSVGAQLSADVSGTSGDGLSNLDESILGADSAQLELQDSYFTNAINFRTSIYESQVPNERPYYEYREEVPDPEYRPDYEGSQLGLIRTLTIDIDDAGTGTFDDYPYYQGVGPDYQIWTSAATRTNTGDSVIWQGESTFNSHGEFLFLYQSSVETKSVNAQKFSADGSYRSRWSGSNPAYLNVYEYALIGEPVADSTECEPLSGTLTHEFVTGDSWTQNSASKGVDDQFWTVVETAAEVYGYPDTTNGYTVDLAEIVDTYLTRTLGMTFYCDYPELL